MSTNSKFLSILLTERKCDIVADYSTPIGILDLAAFLRELGHKVDCYYIDEIPEKRYDLIGLSVFASFYGGQAVKDALYLKNKFKSSKIVVGGRWTKYNIEEEIEILKENDIEVWTKSGEEYFSGDKNIDFNNYPSWSERDFMTLKENGYIIVSSRGCPYNCNFCHNIEKKIYFFSAKRTVDNIELLFKLGLKEIFFVDDIFTIKIDHMLDIYNECKKRGIQIKGRNRYFSHINFINEETAKTMRLFKPVEVQIGIESGDDEMLLRMEKKFKSEMALEKIKLLSKYVRINGLFLIGFPGETVKSLKNTVKFIKKAKYYLSKRWVSIYQPVPNTAGYEVAKVNGTILGERQCNEEVTYIDRNLTKNILMTYKNKILNA